MSKNNACGPWANPAIDGGIYLATVETVECERYGDDGSTVIRTTFRLADDGQSFASNLYLPRRYSNKSQQRLSFLCLALDIEAHELLDSPEQATGRQVALDIRMMRSETANHGNPYCDVRRFLPTSLFDEETMIAANNE